MSNIPIVKLGIVSVSRDCFPIELSRKRRKAVVTEYKKTYGDICEIETIIEKENDVLAALKEACDKGVNALAVFLGNFGPEGPETLLAQKFDGQIGRASCRERV